VGRSETETHRYVGKMVGFHFVPTHPTSLPHYNYFKNQIVMVGITKFWVAILQMYKVSGFFGFKVYPVNLSESEFTELKNLQNGSRVFYSVNSKILQILIQTINSQILQILIQTIIQS